jgi:hypothetical protein
MASRPTIILIGIGVAAVVGVAAFYKQILWDEIEDMLAIAD